MSYDYVIDTYAWVEYFRGSEEGKVAKKYIENGNCAVSSISIAELAEKYKREDRNFDEDFNFIVAKTKIMEVTTEIAILAGKLNYENKKTIKNWGMADAIILATAKLSDIKVVTGDEHFRSLGMIMLRQN